MPTNSANQPISNPLASARKVRIGVIGCGIRISGVIRRLLHESPNTTITAVYDPDADAVIRFRDAVEPGLAVCANSEELCSRDDVDWVFIGSFNCHHAADTIAAFQRGKHVFCEKPLALNVEEATAMQRAQAKSGCHFALGLVLRYSPLYRKVRALLDLGKIGSLLSFEFNETLVFNLEAAARNLRDMIATAADIIDVDHLVPSMAPFAPLLGLQQVFSDGTAPVSVIQNGTPAQIQASVREWRVQVAGRVA